MTAGAHCTAAPTEGGPSHRACEKTHIRLSQTECPFHCQAQTEMPQMPKQEAEDNMW